MSRVPTHLIISHGDYPDLESLAGVMRSLARQLREDVATSYTGDDVFAALVELRDAAEEKVTAAGHVRGSRVPRRQR
jgi:hypothetical protein